MDVQRTDVKRRRLVRRTLWICVPLLVLGAAGWALHDAQPALPTVEAGGLWRGKVRLGPMIRQVRGLGTLIPEETMLIPAPSAGRVEQILVKPGTEVAPDTVLLVLSNPELQLAMDDLRWQIKEAEAKLQDIKAKIQTSSLDLRASAAQLESEYLQSKLKADRDLKLKREGLLADLNLQLSQAAAEQLGKRVEIERQRISVNASAAEAQMAAQQVQIEKLRDAYALKQRQVADLRVRSGQKGVLQAMTAEVGQSVTAGQQLAKVAQPDHLKARVQVPETQVKEVQLGQSAQVDTRLGVVPGRVIRIDPASVNGSVAVDISLDGIYPPGTRPDLTVEGLIELERLPEVLLLDRPVSAEAGKTMQLFKVDPATRTAIRVPVRIGKVSVQVVQVLEGLRPGDEVVLSEMDRYAAENKLRLTQ